MKKQRRQWITSFGGEKSGGAAMERSEVREVLLNAWAEFMPADEFEALMDAWVWEWIKREWGEDEDSRG